MSGYGFKGPSGQRIPVFVNRDEEKIAKTTFPISFNDAQKLSGDYVKRIYDSWDKLHAILLRKEETLRKRWTKKNPEQRERILRAAWSEIPESHRPDLRSLLSKPQMGTKLTASTKDAALFKWPYINIEDLRQQKPLLLYLNARGHNLPHRFSHLDQQAVLLGIAAGAFKSADLVAHVMLLTSQETRASYGKIVYYGDDIEAAFLYREGIQFNVGEGLLVLEVQARLLDFLLECCYGIFQDVPRGELPDGDLPLQPIAELGVANDHLKLFAAMSESSYKIPTKLDTHRLRQLIEAQKASAEDHIWELRQDPGYFQSMLFLYADHRLERLPDISGSLDRHHDDEVFWHNVTLQVVDRAYNQYLHWERLDRWAALLDDDCWGPFSALDPLERLPRGLEHTIWSMTKVAVEIIYGLRINLINATATSPELGAGYCRGPSVDGVRDTLARKNGRPTKDRLIQLFEVLFDPSALAVGQVGPWGVIDEIQRLINDRPDVQKRFSAYLYDMFSEFALVAYVWRELHNFFPWTNKFKSKEYLDMMHERDETDDVLKDVVTIRINLRQVLNEKKPGVLERVQNEGTDYDKSLLARLRQTGMDAVNAARVPLPIATSLRYPVDKPYTKANVEAMRAAENTLDTMWKNVDESFLKINKESLHGIFLRYADNSRELSRTQPWAPRPAPAYPVRVIDAHAEVPEAKAGTTEAEVVPRRPVIEGPRTKVKTRGQPDPSAPNVLTPPVGALDISTAEQLAKMQIGGSTGLEQADASTSRGHENSDTSAVESQTITTVRLKERDLKVFRTMFSTSHDPYQGSIDFKDFRHAMTRVGFGAEKLYGSVWHFTPGGNPQTKPEARLSASTGNRSIQFHEPHPSSEIPYKMARYLGRRLNRAYGWHGGMFVGKDEE
ncbi:hypothetical protein H2200_004748 [Cladophialophora chaetospira]|uniref:Uncharacterized protein n=1 Tax=Cladophialophora chaetospira TaxID=386627 RepID=A0AA38XEC4_9EURO|nr:hypothetical protein H2200_004748 [Cladophialophora chaetospira]